MNRGIIDLYLGIKVEQYEDKSFRMTHLHWVEQIVDAVLGIKNRTTLKLLPMPTQLYSRIIWMKEEKSYGVIKLLLI